MSKLNESKSSQTLASPFPRFRTLLIAGTAALGLAACGGGSDSNGSGSGPTGGGPGSDPNASDSIPTTTSLGELFELTNDAGQAYRLFYIDASHDNGKAGEQRAADPWLMAYDPRSKNNEVIDKKFDGLFSTVNEISPLALHQATVDAGNGELTNYQVKSVSYVQEKEFEIQPGTTLTLPSALMRVGVSAGSTPAQVTDQSGTSADLGLISVRQIVAFNLNDANKAQYVFPAEDSTSSSWKYRLTSMDADASTSVKDFSADLNVQTPLFSTQGASAGSAYGYLVAKQNQGDCLAFVPVTNLSSATCIPNADSTGNVALAQDNNDLTNFITGVYPLNNGVVLAIPEKNTSNALQSTTTLWFYERGSGSNPGKLHLLKNTNGENLKTTGLPMFGPDEAGRAVSKDGNTLYLAASDGGIGGLLGGGEAPGPSDLEAHSFLFKITTGTNNIGWEQVYHEGGKLLEGKGAQLGDFLIDAGSHLIWEINERLIAISLDGQSEILLDGRSSSGSSLVNGAFNTPVSTVSQGDWFFYNRESNRSDYATAIKVDGSRRVELKDCTWIGASTTGNANYAGGNFSSLEPSEVFMACNNKQLAAVDAINPLAGRVLLGSLPESAESIEMGRTAPGPHRLMRVAYESNDDERYDVIYVNTRKKDSLKHLLDSPASVNDVDNLAGLTAPVSGF